MHGVELVSADTNTTPAKKAVTTVINHVRDEHSVLLGGGGYYKNVVRFQPPLAITREELEQAVDALSDVIESVER
ncbi:hypothetical protein [Haladaptatus sp. NG-WS-4]